VKTIGDEVMFVANDAETAVRVAIDLTAVTASDTLLPGARAGVACGPVLAREGDYYGPVVNLAHRLVEIARPGTVIVPGDLRDAIADRSGLEFSRLRPRRLRDIGRVEAWAVRRAATEEEAAASG
jgi:adenylate cyclase